MFVLADPSCMQNSSLSELHKLPFFWHPAASLVFTSHVPLARWHDIKCSSVFPDIVEVLNDFIVINT